MASARFEFTANIVQSEELMCVNNDVIHCCVIVGACVFNNHSFGEEEQ